MLSESGKPRVDEIFAGAKCGSLRSGRNGSRGRQGQGIPPGKLLVSCLWRPGRGQEQGAGGPPTWPGAQWDLGLQFRADGKEGGGEGSVVSTDQSPFFEGLGVTQL